MHSTSSSDEEDSYLGTKKLGKLQANFNNFYKSKKLDQSDEEADYDHEQLLDSPLTDSSRKSAENSTLLNNQKAIIQNDLLPVNSEVVLLLESFPSTSKANSDVSRTDLIEQREVIDVDKEDNTKQNKSVDADDVLKQLDQLAETAKELSEDYNAAIVGNKRGKRKKVVKVAPIFSFAVKGNKRSRPTRNTAQLARLRMQLQLLENSSNQLHNFNQNHQNNHNNPSKSDLIINITDSDDSSNDNPKSPKRLKVEKVTLNPTVEVNINWRCDSEITHKIAVFKFQSLHCIEQFCCKEYNIDSKLILFTINDKPIELKEHCYASLRLKESSIIDGGVLPETYLNIERPKVFKEVDLIKLKIQYMENSKTKDFPVYVKKNDKCEIIFWLIIKELGCDPEDIKLQYDGTIVNINDNIDSLDLEENDCLDLTLTSPCL